MTHKECVQYAAGWLGSGKRCNVVLPEFYCWNSELADVIGFKNSISTVIECKVSRGDFLADKKKSFRINPEQGMGDWRYFCCPKDMIKAEEVPEGWGLLYVYPSGHVRVIKNSYLESADPYKPRYFPKNKDAEFHLLYYYARRANFAGVHQRVLDYRGFNS